jgi:hypothetical protein
MIKAPHNGVESPEHINALYSKSNHLHSWQKNGRCGYCNIECPHAQLSTDGTLIPYIMFPLNRPRPYCEQCGYEWIRPYFIRK